MGYIRHDAIIVTSWNDEHLEAAKGKAEELRLTVTSSVTTINNTGSFLIASDGSKEGWSKHDDANLARHAWMKWVRDNQDILYIDWAHVSYGGDDPELAFLAHHNGESK